MYLLSIALDTQLKGHQKVQMQTSYSSSHVSSHLWCKASKLIKFQSVLLDTHFPLFQIHEFLILSLSQL